MSPLDRAMAIAVKAHAGQTDKRGEPYILHVMRVVGAMRPHSAEQIVAALHDVVEDADDRQLAIAGIELGKFGRTVVRATDSISRRPGEEYAAYIERVDLDDVARTVKLADLRDNVGRLDDAVDPHGSLRKRYAAAIARLTHPD
jgi:(p)ppGpp synthase/HD superfamily hydrolase